MKEKFIQIMYKSAKELNFDEFILTYKNVYLKNIWNNEPYVIENPNIYYDENFEESLSNAKFHIKRLKNMEAGYVDIRIEFHQKYVLDFEKKLSVEDRTEVDFLITILKKLYSWNPNDEIMIDLKETISRKIQNTIDNSYDSNYVFSKHYTIDRAEEEFKEQINELEAKVAKLENHINFNDEFKKKQEKYLNELRKSFQGIL